MEDSDVAKKPNPDPLSVSSSRLRHLAMTLGELRRSIRAGHVPTRAMSGCRRQKRYERVPESIFGMPLRVRQGTNNFQLNIIFKRLPDGPWWVPHQHVENGQPFDKLKGTRIVDKW